VLGWGIVRDIYMKIKYEVAPEFRELEPWICKLPLDFSGCGETIFKSRNEVKVFTYGDYELNVKAFKIPNLVNRFIYVYFRGSKAARSYRYARKFMSLDIATPAPVGYLNCTKLGFLFNSYYISVHYKSEFTLREVLNYQVADHDEILRKWVKFTFEKLHQNNIFHLDYSPGNTLISRTGDKFDFQIIDLNRMRFGSVSFEHGLYNFRQLDTDSQTLGLLAAEYASLCHKDEGKAVKMLISFDQKNKVCRCRRDKIKKMVRSVFRSCRVG
jgi:serine/threonine protein kinase